MVCIELMFTAHIYSSVNRAKGPTNLSLTLGCQYKGWSMYQGHCYQRQTQPNGYFGARAVCASKQAIIAVPNTQAENDFLTTKMNPNNQNHTWIGYSYSQSYGYDSITDKYNNLDNIKYIQRKYDRKYDTDMWEDGSSHTGTDNWRKLEEVEDYVNRDNGKPVTFMRANGDWSFDGEENSYYFVCEKTLGVLYDAKIT